MRIFVNGKQPTSKETAIVRMAVLVHEPKAGIEVGVRSIKVTPRRRAFALTMMANITQPALEDRWHSGDGIGIWPEVFGTFCLWRNNGSW